MAALYYTHKEMQMETATMEQVPCLVHEWDDDASTVAPAEEFEYFACSNNNNNDPFGQGIQVHLLWDMLESKQTCSSSSSSSKAGVRCEMDYDNDDATATVAATLTDAEDDDDDDMQEDDLSWECMSQEEEEEEDDEFTLFDDDAATVLTSSQAVQVVPCPFPQVTC